MLKTLFDDQRSSLNHFFDSIDREKAQEILDKLVSCKGIVIVSGVGKSGHVAEKIVGTLNSTGTRAFFLAPGNALHGDVGFVKKDDLFLCFSKSGASQELIQLIPYIKKKGAYTIAIASVKHSPLEKICDASIVLPLQKEICPYDLAPTTSTVSQMIFGDCLAVALMRAKQFSIAEFAENHPSGLLGRKITQTVGDLMLKNEAIPLCQKEDRLIDVLHELSSKKSGCLLVVDEEKFLQGIFTDGDLRRALETKGAAALQSSMQSLMTCQPSSIEPGKLAICAMEEMEKNTARLITVLPVVNEGRVVGLIRMHDILQKEFS